LPARAQQSRGVGDGEGAGRGKRRIFAERMAGEELRVARKIETGLRSSTRRTASETAISAGWAFSVSVSVSAGPSNTMALSLLPSASSTSPKTCRAGAKFAASALPMPTVWLPWPGNTKTTAIPPHHLVIFAGIGPKDTATGVLSS